MRYVFCSNHLVGWLKTGTITSRNTFSSLVKMHLINSFIHPRANSWPTNWIWGSADLNKKHNIPEESAKRHHPATNQNFNGCIMKYSTEVKDSRSTPCTEDEFITCVKNKLILVRRQSGANESEEIHEDDIKIGNRILSDFYASWVYAILNCSTNALIVEYEIIKEIEGVDKVEQAVTRDVCTVDYEKYYPDIIMDLGAADFFRKRYPLPKREHKRKRSDSDSTDSSYLPSTSTSTSKKPRP